ncbi:protein FEZ [Ziziphus jujuba]|uniref:Protein FEZ n=1 Tax=Ziziphus jujuba TaxID=326968 RepID=A0A6P4A936_ZIZJJ|nr:protein FEZ [Ziziphus jujuba]
MKRTTPPPGWRFHPTDVELVKYYLKRKILGKKLHVEAISEVDIYKYAPWDLRDKSCLRNGDLKWYFFCPREKKYASGSRMKRTTEFGFWKTTGNDRSVHYEGEVVGKIKTLIFHRGQASKGERTNWVMHEYRLEEKGLADRGVVQDSYVLSMIFEKGGRGPRNGAQYGAPYKEEDWISDEEDNCVVTGSSANRSVLMLPSSHNNGAANGTHASGSKCFGYSSESCISDCIPPTCEVSQPVPPACEVPQPVLNFVVAGSSANLSVPMLPSGHDNGAANSTPASGSKCFGSSSESCISNCIPPTCDVPQPVLPTCEVPQPVSTVEAMLENFQVPNDDDDILSLMDCISWDDIPEGNENDKNENPCNLNNVRDIGKTSNFDGNNDIFNDLGDLGIAGLSEDGCSFPGQHETIYTMEQMHARDDFMELMDLDIPLNWSAEAGGLGTGYNTSNNPDQFCHQTSPCAAAGRALPSQYTMLLGKED